MPYTKLKNGKYKKKGTTGGKTYTLEQIQDIYASEKGNKKKGK